MKKLRESYTINADGVPATINIWDISEENVPIYEVITPQLDLGTKALINKMMVELAKAIPITIEEITDTRKILELKVKFSRVTLEAVQKKFPNMSKEKIATLSGILLHKMYGLGEMEIFLADDYLEEIVVNNSNVPISVYHKKHGWLKSSKKLDDEEQIYNFASQIGRKVNRQINSLNPIMDAHLVTGDRVAATLFPISTMGNTITIRKFSRTPWNIVNLIKQNTFSKELAAFLWLAIQYEMNILVAGATAAGKTSMLNAITSLIPPTQRIISVEDTREISLPKDLHWNWIPMTTRNPNPDGQGGVDMLDLIVASLRMRPDRVIVGEVRRKEQAETMFEAMHTGHSVYATIHAGTTNQVRRRLIEPPIAIPKNEVEALHLILVQHRDRKKNIRRTLELAEILVTGKDELEINYLYRWNPRSDTFEKAHESIRIFEDINLDTGLTIQEIKKDLQEKSNIIQWLIDNKLDDLDQLGQVMKMYYSDKKTLVNAMKLHKKVQDIL